MSIFMVLLIFSTGDINVSLLHVIPWFTHTTCPLIAAVFGPHEAVHKGKSESSQNIVNKNCDVFYFLWVFSAACL